MSGSCPKKTTGFTLIELLIVIAIILILIAIALPNFLEAQLRAKVTRTKAELRSLGQATAAYYNDYKIDPNVDTAFGIDLPYRSRMWWGYASHLLTTPNAYIKTVPVDQFPSTDESDYLYLAWANIKRDGGTNGNYNRPYLSLVRVKSSGKEMWVFWRDGDSTCPTIGGMEPMTWQALGKAPWVYLSAGPDLLPTLAWLGAGGQVYATYNPTNGTQSTGDIWVGGY